MLVLGIETSCDETSAAVVRDGRDILSNVIFSQVDIHKRFGGVVPELASRNHLASINSVVEKAVEIARENGDIKFDGVAVTNGPGLIGSLLVGLSFAKGFAYANKLPLCGVNHIEAHLYSVFLNGEGDRPDYPYIGLIVSGGHTSLYKVESIGKYQLLGATRDDAAGEAFDKVAKLMGLGYPGGPEIDRLSKNGNPNAVNFPRGMARRNSYDFSFSGLKTAVLYYKKGFGKYAFDKNKISMEDIAASFQEAVIDTLIKKACRAALENKIGNIVAGGGVCLNSRLRAKFTDKGKREGIRVFFPKPALCADNAAMIAGLGYFKLFNLKENNYNLDAEPNLRIV